MELKEENLQFRWLQVTDKMWARRNEGVHVTFGSPMPGSGKRWMCLVGATVERSRPLELKEIIEAWLRVRFERPLIALRYPSLTSATISTYTIPTPEEAEEWAKSTTLRHQDVKDPLSFLSAGNALPINDEFASVHLFETAGRQDLYVQVCHGWAGAYGAFKMLATLLEYLAAPRREAIEWGLEIERLPKPMVEFMGFDGDFKPSQAALDHVASVRKRLDVLTDSQAFPLPDFQPPKDVDALASHQNITLLDKSQTRAAIDGFKKHNLKVGDGMLHLACIALYRVSERLCGSPPAEEAMALLTLPMGYEKFAPGNLNAFGGEFAPVIAKHVKAAAHSFDEGGIPDLRIEIIDGLISRAQSHIYSFEAHREAHGVLMGCIGSLTKAHFDTLLGISLLGQLDVSPLQKEYGEGEQRLRISKPYLGAMSEQMNFALRIWTFDGEMTVRTVANLQKLPTSVIDMWHEEILMMLRRISVET